MAFVSCGDRDEPISVPSQTRGSFSLGELKSAIEKNADTSTFTVGQQAVFDDVVEDSNDTVDFDVVYDELMEKDSRLSNRRKSAEEVADRQSEVLALVEKTSDLFGGSTFKSS